MSGPATPNEVPFEVLTPAGRAVVSVVAAVIRCGSGSAVDRLVLRSADGCNEDAYAVFERYGGHDQSWWKVTDDLTAIQLQDWPNHRRQRAHPAPPFQQWLDRVASVADREGG